MNINPSSHWLRLVNLTMSQRNCSHGEATHITCKTNPDAATLMSAFGRSRQTVAFLNSKLAHGTPLKTAEDRQRLNQFVNENIRAGHNPAQALNKAYREHGEIGSAASFVSITMPGQISRRDTARPQFANADSAATTAPIGNETIMGLFFLPKGTSVAEFLAAWTANGSKATPIDYAKIFDGLVQLDMSTTGGSYDDSIKGCKAKYPDLWSAVDALSKMPV